MAASIVRVWAGCLLVAAGAGAAAPAPGGRYEEALVALLGEAGRAVVPAHGDAALRDEVLAAGPFEHEPVGPFDLFVLVDDELSRARAARRLLSDAAEGLSPAAGVVAELFDRERGLVSGRRFPIVLAESERDDGQRGFDRVLALLHLCESGPGGYVEDTGPIWTPAQLDARAVRTWDALAVNLAHEDARSRGDAFLEHGLGHEALTLVCQRLLRLGAWGNVPPWLAHGLIDELDIRAHGRAWLGEEMSQSWHRGGSRWRTVGWSGFLPDGVAPPPPTRIEYEERSRGRSVSGGSWSDRTASETRHWKQLRADRESEAPVSLAEMARYETFAPRDRAYARLVVHLVLRAGGTEPGGLLERLDHETPPTEHGMKGMDPLPALVARALGGLEAVARLEAMPAREILAAIGREGLVSRLESLGAGDALALADHRAMSQWLYERWEIPPHRRQELFEAILEVEYHQQRAQWTHVEEALDRAVAAALDEARRFPPSSREARAVVAAFTAALRGDGSG